MCLLSLGKGRLQRRSQLVEGQGEEVTGRNQYPVERDTRTGVCGAVPCALFPKEAIRYYFR